jgi:hypothetical protein
VLDISTLGGHIEHTLQIEHILPHTCVWQELDYRIDICRVTKGGHIQHL